MRYRTNQRPSCRLLVKRKVIHTVLGRAWHQWYDGDEWVTGPAGLKIVMYEDRVCVQYRKDINSLFVPSEQAFGRYIGWSWNDMEWTYYPKVDDWLFLGKDIGEMREEMDGMRELYPDLKRLPLASEDIKILMELTYG